MVLDIYSDKAETEVDGNCGVKDSDSHIISQEIQRGGA